MRQIVVFPNKILRVKTPEITGVDEKLLEDIESLKEVLNSAENGAGLAATQIGIGKRFFGMFVEGKRKIRVFINPKITKTVGEKVIPLMKFENGNEETFLEGCMSFPDLFGEVKRFLKIEVEWEEVVDQKLETRNKILEGFEAIVWQHESEHLDGILFVDHIKEEGGMFYLWKDKEKVKMDINEVLGKESGK